jgi:3-oxoacyl-[acyl-carrier-protein] synthase-3
MAQIRPVIVATGCCIPPVRVPNEQFLDHQFCESNGRVFDKPNADILEQFVTITGIRERRYASDATVASDLATDAAEKAFESSGIDREQLDQVIVAHNFGDVLAGSYRTDMVPCLASRVKRALGIRNPATVAYDLIFGCPGWLQGMINTSCLIRSGEIRRALVIGAETLSRVSDPHDRDSLIYADGAGATILEGVEDTAEVGVLSHSMRSDTIDHGLMLNMQRSNRPEAYGDALFLKMEGRKLYKYALKTVAGAMKDCLDKAGLHLSEVQKILLHQANDKMDEAIVTSLFELYGIRDIPHGICPMTISWLGNSSVATIPTLFDLLLRGQLENQTVASGDVLVFASVGAGMNINAFSYRMP